MRILLADDHDLYREGVQLLLQQLENIVFFEACNRTEIEDILNKQLLDILLLDLDMPGIKNASSVREICNFNPKIAVIVMSGNDNVQSIQACFDAGAAGFIPKSSSTNVMLSAIRIVYAGGKYVPPKIYDYQPTFSLTPRQKEIFYLMTEGQTNKQIAGTLSIAESTVKQHITDLFRKLGVSNRVEAILQAKNIFTL